MSLHPDNAFETAADGGFPQKVAFVDAYGYEDAVAVYEHLVEFLSRKLILCQRPVYDGSNDGVVV